MGLLEASASQPDSSEKSLSEKEGDLFDRGREQLSAKSESLKQARQTTDAKVEEAATGFKRETTSWWAKIRDAFSRASDWITKEDKIKEIDNQLEALRAGYRQLADKAVEGASGRIATSSLELEKPVRMKYDAAELFTKLEGKPAQKMVEEFFAYKGRIGQSDVYGQIGDVQFDEQSGQIRVEYSDGSSLRKFPNSLVLRVLQGGQIQTLEGPFVLKKTKPGPDLKSVGKPPIEPEKARLIPDWEKNTELAQKGLQSLEAAKTAAELRAFIVKEKILPTEELAQLTDTEVENRREAIRDEIAAVGGIVIEWIDGNDFSPAEQMKKASKAMETEAAESGVQEANPLLLTPDMKKTKDVSEGMIVSETQDLERMTKQAEAQLRASSNEIDPKEAPLAPESLSAIVEALKKSGKKKDGKFATPAGFRDALVEAGFKLPVTLESEDVKNLHDAYKKAAFGKKKP